MIKKTVKGWLVDVQPGGRGGKRIRKTLPTQGEAKRFESYVLSQAVQGLPWNPKPSDMRSLSDLCELWYKLHGHTLSDGDGRFRNLLLTCGRMGNPVAASLTSKQFSHYRQERLSSGVKPNTVNHEQAYLRAVFNELSRLGEWEGANPIAGLRRLTQKETELSFLSSGDIERLLSELLKGRNTDAYYVAKLCLATGARWSEAEGLHSRHIHGGKVVFENPKDKERRAVPVDADLLAEVMQDRAPGKLFSSCYSAFRDAMGRAGINTPRGQLSHVLRHTFASHFMQNGGNILTLQRVLGHASLTMTMRYAHLAPGHLEEVLRLNPLCCGLFVDSDTAREGSAVA